MQIKRKIPSFVFGVTIGLLIGVAFFVFKLNDVFNRLKDAASEKITIIEQPIKNDNTKEKDVSKNKYKIDLGNSKKINYKEVDSLINSATEINVATESLLSERDLKIIRIGTPASIDTSALRIANVNETENTLYSIEFWKTPLNSKGYRFSKNKVLLYGFVDYNNVLLYEFENNFYLKAENQVYKLIMGADFKPLEKVIDSDLLAKIN